MSIVFYLHRAITYITVNGASQENTVDAHSTATCGGRRALKGKSAPPPSPPGRKMQKEKTATTASPTISPKPGGGRPTAGGSALTTSPLTSPTHGPIVSPVSPTNPQSMAPSKLRQLLGRLLLSQPVQLVQM